MKEITLFILRTCPYCIEALRLIKFLIEGDERYRELPIALIDEYAHPEITDKFDYNYVPAFYVDGKLVHEGAADIEVIRRVFDMALGY